MRAFLAICFACAVSATITKVERACFESDITTVCKFDAQDAAAWAEWEDSSNRTGWSVLRVYGNSSHAIGAQARAMGFLEGSLTQHRIYEAKTNMFAHAFGDNKPASPKVAQFYADQLQYVREMIQEKAMNNPYWAALQVVMAQFDGLVNGYNSVAPASEKMTELDMYIHNGAGDLEDLGSVLPGVRREFSNERLMPDINMLDCSSLVRLTKDDIWSGHTTWRDYGNMSPRAYKRYHLNVGSGDASREWSVSFSSTPGFLSSKDDFYIVKSGWSHLTVMETTNGIFNQSLYNLLTPRSVFTWQRTMLANLVALNGREGTEIYAEENSGTYNNQWIIVDLREFSKRKENSMHAPRNTLWILEQIPGYTQRADVTAVLNEQRYWASYNVPYFPEIYNMSGYNTMNSTSYSYEQCPRANIFRQRAVNIETAEDMRAMMQYNDYKNDPLSLGSPLNAISSRYDLVADNPRPFGGIDSKITSSKMAASLQAQVISGPTQQQPAFSWGQFQSVTHLGQPQLFDFAWQTVG